MDKHHIGFAITGSLMSILFLALVNYLTSPDYIWFIFPTLLLLLWPLSLLWIAKRKKKLYAVACSLLIIVFFATINYFYASSHLWFLYVVFPFIWWPISMIVGNKAKTFSFALFGSTSTIVYYTLINVVLSPAYPWAIYPAYLLLWWPIFIYYVNRKKHFSLSVIASVLSIIFFISVNVVSSPQTIWAVYPIFLILWWPLSMYYYQEQKKTIMNGE